MDSELVFLKLGGSLITDKSAPRTPRLETLRRLSAEISHALRRRPTIKLLLGHGSGSFGHMDAARYGTAAGVHSQQDWIGFHEVWRSADALDRIVIDALADAGLPVVRVAASGAAYSNSGTLSSFPTHIVQSALGAGLIPVVFGDVVFDRAQGGAIASTESIFSFLAPGCRPRRILMAGLERGVFYSFPSRDSLLPLIRSNDRRMDTSEITGSAFPDVTGGMQSKVETLLHMCREEWVEEALIFSGEEIGNVESALMDKKIEGTYIRK